MGAQWACFHTKAHYDSLINKGTYEEMVAAGRFKFSHRAMQARLLADLYISPFKPLTLLSSSSSSNSTTTTTTTTTTTITPFYLLKAALLVNLYQDEPILNQAFRFLQKLMDIDELMTQWRHRHALMVRHL